MLRMIPTRAGKITDVKLVLFPGMGADRRMFHRQKELGCEIEFPALPEPVRGGSLASFVKRIDIPPGPVIFGGVSMGGMVALELARIHPCRGVLLLSSARNIRMVSPMIQWLSGILKLAPNIPFHLPAWSLFTERLGAIDKEDRSILAQALHDHPLDRLRDHARMILEWKGVEDPGVPVFHLHGDRDEIIPIRFVKPDAIVRGAGHAMNMSHAEEVNLAVKRWIARQTP